MGSESEEHSHHKVDRRKKRTSSNQYMLYIEMMEEDPIFAAGRLTRDVDINYLPKKWKELAARLNACGTGPKLTTEEWRKRLNDWKNTTRCKYRRSISGEKDITLTSLELRALELFGKTAPTNVTVDQLSMHLKEEKSDDDVDHKIQRGSDTLQKQLQAAVDEAIRGGDNDEEEDEDGMQEQEEHELLSVPLSASEQAHVDDDGGGGIDNTTGNVGGSQGGATTYRTIVVENPAQFEEDNHEEFIAHGHHGMATTSAGGTIVPSVVSTSTPATAVTKLINGDIPLKRLRSQGPEQIIYEVKNAPVGQRTITVHSTPTATQYLNQAQQQQRTIEVGSNFVASALAAQGISSQDGREIARQLKRLADIKAEKLKFDVARFKFNNPGFHYNIHL